MLELQNISKSFPGVKALDNVSLEFRPGEIHALLGENGAGKSTLIKVISGIYSDYEGTVILNGDELKLKSYNHALEKGISIVNQEIQVIPESTIAENIMLDKLDRFRKFGGRLDWNKLNRRSEKYLEMVELDLRPDQVIGPLSAAQKQLVQIAKALSSETDVLLLDEPTSSITEHEVRTLFRILRNLRDKGVTLIYVSHKLEEIFELCDRVSVIRDGKWIGTDDVAGLDRDTIIEMMIGRECTDEYLGIRPAEPGDVILEAENIVRANKVDNISFSLKKGEILGFYGLVGSGRTELARILIGEDQPDSGIIKIRGKDVVIPNVANALYGHGIGYVSENRKEEGLFLEFPVKTNIGITIWNRILHKISRKIDQAKQDSVVNRIIDKLQIKVTSPDQEVQLLSGGNQQKVSIAKWLAADCDILIIDEPTVGVDVGAKEYIHELIWDLAANQGKTIILISSDLPEMVKLARRILVFRSQKIVGELTGLTGDPCDTEDVSLRIGSYLV